MGRECIAEVICVYCGKVMGTKVVNVPESFPAGKKIATHGTCDDCIEILNSFHRDTD